MSPVKNRSKILLIVIGVFVLGAITGASLDGVYRMHANNRAEAPGTNKEKLFDSLKRELNLTSEQSQQMQSIVDEARADYRSLRHEVRPRYDAVRQNARSRIRALLTPDQQRIFDIRVAEKDAAREDKDKN
ncbi:MAG TPA: hypothetical protein VMM84_04915 [Pyrinomonadaceae bacterium]|nr:hypothetical protein [Pyrinomonadaceae bacterium]